MPTITTSIVDAGQIVPVTSIDNTDYAVARWVVLASNDSGNVFALNGSDHDLVVNGSVSGGNAIAIGDAFTDDSNRVVVNATGDVQGSATGVSFFGSNSELINRGDI